MHLQVIALMCCVNCSSVQVKLVVVDSVAFPFRHGFTDMFQRTRVLGEMGNRLMQLAHTRDIAVWLGKVAESPLICRVLGVSWRQWSSGGKWGVLAQVVLMNQVTTQRSEDGSSKIIPALGAWAVRWDWFAELCCWTCCSVEVSAR